MLLSVAYRSQAALEALAADLAHQSLPPALWLVVDNAPESAPLQADELQVGDVFRLDVLRAKEGEGFGAGCNRGFDHLAKLGWRGWVWLLNPDTALPRGMSWRHSPPPWRPCRRRPWPAPPCVRPMEPSSPAAAGWIRGWISGAASSRNPASSRRLLRGEVPGI